MSQQPVIALPPADPADEYANLPEFIKMGRSREEWLWLSDDEKARLVQNETEPEA